MLVLSGRKLTLKKPFSHIFPHLILLLFSMHSSDLYLSLSSSVTCSQKFCCLRFRNASLHWVVAIQSLTEAEQASFKKGKKDRKKIVLCGGALVTDRQFTMSDNEPVSL